MRTSFGRLPLAAALVALAPMAPVCARTPAPQATRPQDDVRAAAQSAAGAALDAGARATPAGGAPMTARDLITLPRLGGATVAPDGQVMVYPVTTTDPATLARSSALYIQALEPGSPATELTDLADAGSAVFGGDGWLYYLAPGATADGNGGDGTRKSQVWRAQAAADGSVRDARQVTGFAVDVNGFVLSPDAGKIAVYGDIPRDCPRFGCPARPAAQTPTGSGTLYDAQDGFVRHWDTWKTPGVFSRIFVFDMVDGTVSGDGIAADGPPDVLTGDTPTRPFGGNEELAFAADGGALFFTARRADREEPASTNLDIWRNPLDGSAPANLTVRNKATDALPTPSPDGRWLAYTAMARPGYESDRQVVMLRDLATGETRALTDGVDRSFASLAWTPDSLWLVATAADTLDTPAYRINPIDGTAEKLDLMPGDEGHIGGVQPLSYDRLLFTRDSIAAPAELYLARAWQQGARLTSVATARIDALAPVATTRFSFPGAQGDTVWGQITKPADTGAALPAILYVHGGPQGSFNDAWSNRWNPRVLASQGYAVISIDFHGSTGYGQAFTDSINQDWGGKPLIDLQEGLAAALSRDPQIDGSRACAMGASYGGYMMNWIEGHWADRFDCIVQHDGLFDMRSFYYSTEESWFPRWDFGGSYAENSEVYERWNPVNFVDTWRTPMLVVTGQKDFRVPYTQALGAFTALQQREIPAELLVFPDENHWVTKPANSLQWHETVFAWLDRWLKRGGAR